MRLLILGGTKNLGRHLVEAAFRDGHEVTLFNRGLTDPDAYPAAARLIGERAAPDALAAGEWDGVVDMSGFLLSDVRRSAELLRDRVGHYTFMSSIAVYSSKVTPGMTEDAPLLPWPEGAPEDVFSMDLYGPSKVRCEQSLTEVFGPRAAALRSGFVIGPYSPDFGNWGVALAAGKTLECAARPDQPIQYLDARDLADFLAARDGGGSGGSVQCGGAGLAADHGGVARRLAVGRAAGIAGGLGSGRGQVRPGS
jgi:2'-hydroxyisoflavone reductase